MSGDVEPWCTRGGLAGQFLVRLTRDMGLENVNVCFSSLEYSSIGRFSIDYSNEFQYFIDYLFYSIDQRR